jgi:hypothetical protein
MRTSVKNGRDSAQDALTLQSNERLVALTEFVKTGRCAEVPTNATGGRIERTGSPCLSALEMRLR